MRWLILALLLVNAAACWWWQAQRDARLSPPAPVRQAPDESAPRLLLLSEVPPAAAPQRRTATAAAGVGREAGVEQAATPAPAPGEVAQDATPASAPAEAAQEAAPRECVLLGGASDRDQLRDWRAALRSADIAVASAISEYPEQQVSAYLVSVAGAGDAQGVVEALAAAGIEGLLMEASGADGGRISAGLFRVRENAMRQRQRLEELGYAAEVVPQVRERSGFWVEVRGSAGLRERAAALLARRIPEAEPAWRSCEAAAEPPPESDGQR